MKYDTVVFDLDGTLTDSAEGILRAVRYALNRIGRPIPENGILQRFLGPPLADSFIRWCGMSEEEGAVATEYYREVYWRREGWKVNAVYPGIRGLLRALKKQGTRLAVATGKPANCAIPILEYFGLRQYFDAVACPDDSDMHADKALLIGRVLPDRHGKALMVGDTAGDVLGAHTAGIDSCAAMWGYGDRNEILQAGPVYSLSSPDELSRLLTGSVPRRGMFVSLEGVDGCGKTTQQKLLAERLTKYGFRVRMTREPGGCAIAEEIRKIVLAKDDLGMCAETEALLFAAARAQHVREVILPAVEKGEIVLCDRFVDSSLVYQGTGRGLGEDWIRQINRAALSVGLPEVTLYLKLEHHEALARRGKSSEMDRMEKSGDSFFARTEQAYDTLAAREPERIVTVDAGGQMEEIAEAVFHAVFKRLEEAEAC